MNQLRRNTKFWEKVGLPDGCWLWKGAKKRLRSGKIGYGNFWDGTRTVLAHRFAFELFFGSLGEQQANHKRSCNNDLCVNPMHLYAGTQVENNLDRASTGANCGVRHWAAQLTVEDVLAIREAPGAVGLLTRLSAKYNVSKSTISNTRRGKIWKSVGGPISQ